MGPVRRARHSRAVLGPPGTAWFRVTTDTAALGPPLLPHASSAGPRTRSVAAAHGAARDRARQDASLGQSESEFDFSCAHWHPRVLALGTRVAVAGGARRLLEPRNSTCSNGGTRPARTAGQAERWTACSSGGSRPACAGPVVLELPSRSSRDAVVHVGATHSARRPPIDPRPARSSTRDRRAHSSLSARERCAHPLPTTAPRAARETLSFCLQLLR